MAALSIEIRSATRDEMPQGVSCIVAAFIAWGVNSVLFRRAVAKQRVIEKSERTHKKGKKKKKKK